MRIQRRVALRFVAFGLAVVTASSICAADLQDLLTMHGKHIVRSSERNVLALGAVIKTMETPLRAYQITFKTNSQALMAQPNADKDQTAYLINQGMTALWQEKFCTPALKEAMRAVGIDPVSGKLTNMKGETQRIAVCMKD